MTSARSNLPPGVTSKMIEDAQGCDLWDAVCNRYAQTDLDEEETMRAVEIGIVAVRAQREAIRQLVNDRAQEIELDRAVEYYENQVEYPRH